MDALCAFSAVDVVFGSHTVLRNVTAALFPGNRVVLSGANGSGKSTLIRLLLGVQTARSGQVQLFGCAPHRFRSIPQCGLIGDLGSHDSSFTLPTDRKVADLLTLFHGTTRHRLVPTFKDLLARLALDRLFPQEVGSLSLGERKRLMCYLSLAKQPELLLADEPFENLDAQSREQIASTLGHFASLNPHMAFLWISHRPDEILHVATHRWEISGTQLLQSEIVAP